MSRLFSFLFGWRKRRQEKDSVPPSREMEELSTLMETIRSPTSPEDRGQADYARLQRAQAACIQIREAAKHSDQEQDQVAIDAALLEIEERLHEIKTIAQKAQDGARTLVRRAIDTYKMATNGWHRDTLKESMEVHQETLSTLEQNKGWLTVPLGTGRSESRRWIRNAALLSAQMAVLSDAESNQVPTSYSVQSCGKILLSLLDDMREDDNTKGFLLAYAIDVESIFSSLVDHVDFLTEQEYASTLRATVRDVEKRFQQSGYKPPHLTSILGRVGDLENRTRLARRVVRTVSRQPTGMPENGLVRLMSDRDDAVLSATYNLVHRGFLRRKDIDGTSHLLVARHKVPSWWMRSD